MKRYKEGEKVVVEVVALEYVESGHTIWIHGPEGGTVLRIKTFGGKITSAYCKTNPVSHGDIVVHGDIHMCLARPARKPRKKKP